MTAVYIPLSEPLTASKHLLEVVAVARIVVTELPKGMSE